MRVRYVCSLRTQVKSNFTDGVRLRDSKDRTHFFLCEILSSCSVLTLLPCGHAIRPCYPHGPDTAKLTNTLIRRSLVTHYTLKITKRIGRTDRGKRQISKVDNEGQHLEECLDSFIHLTSLTLPLRGFPPRAKARILPESPQFT